MKNNIFFAVLFAIPSLAAAQGEFSFDTASRLPAAPEVPAVSGSVAAEKQGPAVHPAAGFMGKYRLTRKESGNCYQDLEIVPQDFLNTPLGNNIGIYGLPAGQGLIVSQVLEINAGLRFDKHENPMGILPLQGGLMGYRPRQAELDGKTLVYKTGELSVLKPAVIKTGEILEAVLDGSSLKLSKGAFDGNAVFFKDVCRYELVK